MENGGWDWRRAVQLAEEEAVKQIKWTKDGESRKFVKAFDSLLGTQRYPWCAATMHWLLNELGCNLPLIPGDSKTSFALCETWKLWAKEEGFLKNPKEEILHGDVVLFQFDSDSSADHIGIAVGFKYITKEYPGGRSKLTRFVRTVEGNTSHSKCPEGMLDIKFRDPELIMNAIRIPKGYKYND